MKPFGKVSAAAVGADPIADIANVKDENIVLMPPSIGARTDMRAVGLLLYAEGAAAPVTVQVWCQDEGQTPVTPATRRFRQFGGDFVVPVSGLVTVLDADNYPYVPPGRTYLRVTAGQGAGIVIHAVLA